MSEEPIKYKRGRLSNDDKKFINANVETLTFEEMAKHILKTPEMIGKYVTDTLKITKALGNEADSARYDLTKKEVWPFLKDQFFPKELDFFKAEWGKMISQFNCDVLPTEEDQIIEAIRLSVFMNRCSQKQKESAGDLQELTARIIDAKTKLDTDPNMGDNERTRLRDLVRRGYEERSFLETAVNSAAKDYVGYLAKKDTILKNLKGTRDQRVERIQTSNKTIINWIQRLIDDKDYREECGYAMARMEAAFLKQKEKLADFHVYDDQEVDQPFLNHETVIPDVPEIELEEEDGK